MAARYWTVVAGEEAGRVELRALYGILDMIYIALLGYIISCNSLKLLYNCRAHRRAPCCC